MTDDTGLMEGVDQLKSMFEMFRSALGMVKDVQGLLPDGEKKEAALRSLDEAKKASDIAEASIAQALGYELCKCQFPPTPMLTVGFMSRHGRMGESSTVYECPRCGINTAGPWSFTRTAGKIG